ncbi:hypothetical protein B0H14DRAFT_3855984 [Mycena olivaceomarginata]|nr:hypothetical protein B0H14DRAFT_3855984 [Mycena olivaceomarginata]
MSYSFLPHWHCARIITPTSTVQLECDTFPQALPTPEPTTSQARPWTRFIFISDTYGKTFPWGSDAERNTERSAPHDGSTRYLTQLKCSQSKSDWRKVLKFVSSIIAGNRAFILDREWYDVNWTQTGRHGNEATWEIYRLLSELFDLSMRITTTRRSPNVGGPARAFSYDKADGEAMMGAFPSTDILLSHTALRITSSTSPTKPTTRGALPLLRASLPSAHACTSSGTFTRREAHIHLWTRGDGPSTPDSARTMSPDKLIIEEEGEQTVFVNAANHPSGPNVPREYGQVDAGGVGFQPVVVDLLD